MVSLGQAHQLQPQPRQHQQLAASLALRQLQQQVAACLLELPRLVVLLLLLQAAYSVAQLRRLRRLREACGATTLLHRRQAL